MHKKLGTLKSTHNGNNQFKKKNEVIDKQIAEIIRKCKNLLYLKKKL